jgi:hypothetical protein
MLGPFLAALLLAALPSPFPTGRTTAICGTRAIPYQQQAVAATSDAVWVACRSAGTILRISPSSGRVLRSTKLAAFHPWAISAGAGGLWTIDRDRAEAWRLDPRTGTRIAKADLPAAPASLWVGAGSAWVGFDGLGFARIDARTRRVTTAANGDGVSAFATDGKSVFAVSHRDNSVSRLDLRTGRVAPVATGLADTRTASTEEAVFAFGSLWITGRGLDLLRVEPATGKVAATIDVGPAGFFVARAANKILVASYTAAGARRGDPLVGSVGLVDPSTNTLGPATRAVARSYLSGLAVRGGSVFAADTVLGRLVRLPLPG